VTELDSVFSEDWPEDHRAGFVAVVGRPNVGKSTLINAILNQKIAIVTPKPQTTQRQQLGIYTVPHGQIILVDTPGLHRPQHKLGEFMVQIAENALRDADVILWVLDVSAPPGAAERQIAETIAHSGTPVILALNKVDLLADDPQSAERLSEHEALVQHEKAIPLSALHATGIETLIATLFGLLPLGPRFFPADQVSEVNLRYLAAETIREQVMLATEQEIPHAVAVEISEYKERSEDMTYISATLYVERESQKGILIGQGGSMIKRLGQAARQELESALQTQVYLDLRVKVLKNWRSNEDFMRRLGYRLFKD
jgi:GTPase